jgi:hypothetical protein
LLSKSRRSRGQSCAAVRVAARRHSNVEPAMSMMTSTSMAPATVILLRRKINFAALLQRCTAAKAACASLLQQKTKVSFQNVNAAIKVSIMLYRMIKYQQMSGKICLLTLFANYNSFKKKHHASQHFSRQL